MMEDAKLLLKSLIEDLREKLELYVLKHNANSMYIYKQNRHIKHLTEIYNTIPMLQYIEVWSGIENEVTRLMHQDQELCGVIIRLRLKEYGQNFIQINHSTL